MKDISVVSFALALVASGFPIAVAKVEEKNDIRKFGGDYSEYMRTTKMFIPFIV